MSPGVRPQSVPLLTVLAAVDRRQVYATTRSRGGAWIWRRREADLLRVTWQVERLLVLGLAARDSVALVVTEQGAARLLAADGAEVGR